MKRVYVCGSFKFSKFSSQIGELKNMLRRGRHRVCGVQGFGCSWHFMLFGEG